MKKVIEIYIKDPLWAGKRTDEEIAQDREYACVMRFLVEHLNDAKVVSKVIKTLASWQQRIIEDLVGGDNSLERRTLVEAILQSPARGGLTQTMLDACGLDALRQIHAACVQSMTWGRDPSHAL